MSVTTCRPTAAALPPGYPPEFERRLTLHDGRTVQVRPIRPDDAPELAEAIATADSDTLHRRFLGMPPRSTPRLVAFLTTVDYMRGFALARDPASGRGIAIARYEEISDGVVEVAVVVDAGWRRIGLGSALLAVLAEAARDRGIHSFSATYLASNRSVAALLKDSGAASRQLIKQGVAECAVAIDRQRATEGDSTCDRRSTRSSTSSRTG